MDGVAVVGGEEQAARQGLAAGLGGEAQRLPDAGEHVGEEGAHGPLAGAAAHLLVVEEAVELPEALRALRAEEPLQGGVGAAQIVNAGGLEEFTLRPDAHRRLPGAEHQIGGQDVPRVHPQLLRQQGGEGGAAAQGVEGLHVLLGVVVVAPVHVPLLVDGQAGDGEQIPVQIDLQAGKARRLQPGGCSGRRVIGAGAVLNIFHQLVGCLHGKASFFHYYRAGGGKIKG